MCFVAVNGSSFFNAKTYDEHELMGDTCEKKVPSERREEPFLVWEASHWCGEVLSKLSEALL